VKNPTFSKYFEDACLLSDDSTGLYLFSETSDDKEDIKDNNGDTIMATFECRQFPKKSGYPEDPATGIAAAALAVYTHRRRHLQMNLPNASFKFRQGTAMGRPSLITIRNIQYHDNDPNQTKKIQIVSLQCGGRVEIDDEETLTF
jgi:Phenazine biosynthesis-like protein